MPACHPLFSLARHFLQNTESIDSDFRARVVMAFETMDRNISTVEGEITSREHVRYAMTAFIDELISTTDSKIKESWLLNPLQQLYFGVHTAGEGFYTHLSNVREKGNTHLLEIYYICLALGFKGRYRVSNGHAHAKLVSDTRDSVLNQSIEKQPDTLTPIARVYETERSNPWLSKNKILAGMGVTFMLFVFLNVVLLNQHRNSTLKKLVYYKSIQTHHSIDYSDKIHEELDGEKPSLAN